MLLLANFFIVEICLNRGFWFSELSEEDSEKHFICQSKFIQFAEGFCINTYGIWKVISKISLSLGFKTLGYNF